ncbi:MAG: YitT family protein, partial [Clostridia bacterium]|nr:YitT family protein [Clostridia bacterium]
FEIITDKYEEISKEIIEKIHHGVTVMPATGMYTGKDTEVMICVIIKHQIIELQKIIAKYPGTFAYIGDVSETMGNFKRIAKQ